MPDPVSQLPYYREYVDQILRPREYAFSWIETESGTSFEQRLLEKRRRSRLTSFRQQGIEVDAAFRVGFHLVELSRGLGDRIVDSRLPRESFAPFGDDRVGLLAMLFGRNFRGGVQHAQGPALRNGIIQQGVEQET